MMKKLAFILTLIPFLAGAFPVHTNRFDFDPSQSTGQFDDYLWRWSGYDDQSVELIFRNITAPSNIGFRLAYPQRGRTFLDVLDIPNPTNVSDLVVTPWLITYNYTPLYPTITTPAFSNVFVTNFILHNIEGVAILSNQVVRTVVPETATNIFTIGDSTVTNVGSNGRTISNLFLTATAQVVSTSSPFPVVPEVRLHTNFTIGVTTTVTTVDSREYLPAIPGNTNFYSIGENRVQNGDFAANLAGWDAFTTDGAIATQNVFWSGGKAIVRSTTNILQQSISGLTIGQRYFLFANIGSSATTGTVTVAYNDTSTTAPAISFSTNFVAASPSFALSFRAGNISTNAFISVDEVSIRPVGTNRFVDTSVVSVPFTSSGSFSTQNQSAVSTITNQVYSVLTNNYFYTTFNIPRLNIPPDGPYFAEILTYSGSSPTNATQSRTLAKGQVTVENSIWGVTNYAGFTNYPGPWEYLLQDGSRAMAGNLNMGGFGVTNASVFSFSSGPSITASNVNLWNSFIVGTNVGLVTGTEFGGDVTGTYDNITLKKDALVGMDFVGFNSNFTTQAEGRLVATDTGSLQFGLRGGNVNVDIGHETLVYVRNGETNGLVDGDVVFFSGNIGDVPLVKRASATNEIQCRNLAGIVTEPIPVNGFGRVTWYGQVRDLTINPHTVYTNSTILYLSTVPGQFTNVPPKAPNHRVVLGRVERNQSSGGGDIIHVQIDIGEHLEYLHDVNVDSRTTNDLLIYNGTVWTNYARTNLNSIYLPLAGGTMSGELRIQRNLTASTALTITNSGLFQTGLRIDFSGSSPIFLDINGSGDEYTFTDTTANFHGNTITNAIVAGYLTVTGAAATYVNTTNLPAGIVTTNNLSTIAGSGLGVESNQLVVTNVAGTFEALTGNRFVLGNGALTNIATSAIGAFVAAEIIGSNSISNESSGASQRGYIWGSAKIDERAYGSTQRGYFNFGSSAYIGPTAYGASQIGHLDINSSATNNARGAIQLMGGGSVGEQYRTTSSGKGSILLGPGTQTNAYGILANGPIESLNSLRGNFVGNAAGLTNFPSSILTVSAGNAAYWRITTAPTGATSSGSSGQMAVSGTNLFIYSPNALGVGTARWLRVNAEANW